MDNFLENVLGQEVHQQVAIAYRAKLRSFSCIQQEFASQPARQTPRFMCAVGTPQLKESLLYGKKGNVVLMRPDVFREYVGSMADILDTPIMPVV